MNIKELRKIVRETLKEVGIRVNLKGFYYLQESLILHYNHEFSCYLYADVAKQYRSTPDRIERDIRTITLTQQKELKEYFKVNYKITNSILFKLLKDKLNDKLEDLNVKLDKMSNLS